MDAKEREQFYDDEIAPALAQLSRKCVDNGLSMLAVVEWHATAGGESEFGRTLGLAEKRSQSMCWFDLFVGVNANFDRFCLAFCRWVHREKVPHTSMYLSVLGIKPNPEDRDLPPAGTTATGAAGEVGT